MVNVLVTVIAVQMGNVIIVLVNLVTVVVVIVS